ncbi:MAG: flagellar hook-length control protein FliK, partial [Siculibacillus sp.]|nr:flagellar hook-length control protein FliK [Siculibacillus sp.]
GTASLASAPPSSSGGEGVEAVEPSVGTTASIVSVAAPPPPPTSTAARVEDDAVGALVRAVVSGLGLAGSLTAARSSEAMEAAAALATIGPERELKPPPPRRGQAPRGQAALPVDGIGPGGVEELARRALERTEGALARIRLEQFAALDRRGDDPVRAVDGGVQRQWTAEMPIAAPQGTGVVQMTVERDGGRARAEGGKAPTAWRVRFSLDVEPLGPIHARIGLSGERLSIGLWAERPDAAARLGGDVGRLQGALEAAAIPVESIHLATGRPASDAAPAGAGRFVDVKL